MRSDMHAQRCPVAKLMAENQKNGNLGRRGTHPPGLSYGQYPPKQCHGIKSILAEKDGPLLPCPPSAPQKKGKKSIFQNLQKEKRVVTKGNANQALLYDKDKESQRGPHSQTKVFNENCSIHGGLAGRESRHIVIPKGINYPLPGYVDSRQMSNAERLKNWRRSSLNVALNHHALIAQLKGQETASPAYLLSNHHHPVSKHPANSFAPRATHSALTMTKKCPHEDLQCPRPQIPKGRSFFSAGSPGCVESPVDDNRSQKILGLQNLPGNKPVISGLLTECTNRNMGVSF
ncbi:uncharacterized protein [Palaemon carinicauda]|uniref:uncharacterized protein n=1 Tax=Palaemon carinicauda TaxID=392227 RepID=UPI0035B666AB